MATYSKVTGNKELITKGDDDIIDGNDSGSRISAGNGTNLVNGGEGNDTIYAGNGNDFINSGNGRREKRASGDKISAGDGNNSVLSGRGSDVVVAGKGNDTIFTGGGDDTIFAGKGNNIINAGTGNDVIHIGNGADRIILEGNGSATVFGFDVRNDKLRLGESLLGKSLDFSAAANGKDTLVKADGNIVATLKGVKSGSSAIIDTEPLYKYQATDLGTDLSTTARSNPNGAVNATSINDFGQIAGRFDTGALFTNTNATTGAVNAANPVRQGFVWENGKTTAITSTGPKNGQSDFGAKDKEIINILAANVNTISDRGVILGTADEVRQPNPLPTDRALEWNKDASGTYKLVINDFGGKESYYFDINNSKQIAGRNILADGFEKPILIENGKITDLANLGGDGGTARALNNKGQIVGSIDSDGKLDDAFVNTAALWEKDATGAYKLKNLGKFGADQASLREINDAGQIIGTTTSGKAAVAATATTPAVASTLVSDPFILRDGVFTKLGSLGGKTGTANGINQFGQVVGTSADKDGKNRAFVWNAGVITDLNSLVTAPITYNGAAVTLTSAVGINNFGDIAATGTYTFKDAAGKDATGTRSYLLKGIANNAGAVALEPSDLQAVVTGKGKGVGGVGADQNKTIAQEIAQVISGNARASGNSPWIDNSDYITPLVASAFGSGSAYGLNEVNSVFGEPLNFAIGSDVFGPKR
jgi:probable HAF family extracellular repeat protein